MFVLVDAISSRFASSGYDAAMILRGARICQDLVGPTESAGPAREGARREFVSLSYDHIQIHMSFVQNATACQQKQSGH